MGVPVLAVYGSADRMVDPEANVALAKQASAGATTMILKDLNHLFRASKASGLTISPDLLELVSDWAGNQN